jgi:hypothetical protein
MTNYEALKIKTALTTLRDSGNISEYAFKEMINCKPLTVKAPPLGNQIPEQMDTGQQHGQPRTQPKTP